MYSLRKPTQTIIQKFIETQSRLPFPYPEVGYTQAMPPATFAIDHNCTRLGFGATVFAQAKAALHRWEMFRLGWVELCWPDAPIAVGATVAVLGYTFGLWSLNACRIVYVIEEAGEIERFGFAYGALPDHIARGEERFTVEWHHQNDSVWYNILAFSRPNQFMSRMGYPLMRRLQHRFAQESLAAMRWAVADRDNGKVR